MGDAWGCLCLYWGYLQESLTGITEDPEANSQDSMTLKVLYINITETAEEAGARGYKTKAGYRAKVQGRCSVKDLEISVSMLETSR